MMRLATHRLKYTSRLLRLLPPELPGKTRLARRLLGSSLQTQEVQIHTRYGCTFVVPSLREPIGFHLLIDGVYEATAMKFLLDQIREGSVFVDIGANIGAFTLPAARKIGRAGCILAIEPSPRIAPYLKRNIALNGCFGVRIKQCAAFNQDLPAIPFYEAPVDHFGMGSLGAQFHAHPITVPAQRLDQILDEEQIRRVNLIKVDVEGFEAAVFQGAERLLTGRNPPLILFEFCDWAEARMPAGAVGDAQRVLRDYGYEIRRLSDFACGRGEPLRDVLVEGFEMLVAVKP